MKSLLLPGPREILHLSTAKLRSAFLVEDLFVRGELRIAVTDMDRLAMGAAMPVTPLRLPPCPELGGAFFCQRRELGIVNLNEPGHVVVGGIRYSLEKFDFLYVGAENEEISFEACGDSSPAFYFLSCTAHQSLPVRRIGRNDVPAETIGDSASASRRVLRKYVHPDGAKSCQLVMGRTELEPGSVWNTMPPHTHARRSEIYLYYGLGEDGIVFHLLGEPDRTRHVVAGNLQAVLSPSWSIHTGAGTKPYSFIWGMAGENQSFEDMNHVQPRQLR